MSLLDPRAVRRFAVAVVKKLRNAGFEALWAGGCVRDELMGRTPEDYDVATSAAPDQVRDLFGARRTLAVGAAFGVITVLGPRRAGQVEVTTFRSDAPYSDGRHPDQVTFSTAREDALRRDFTINGMFFDPLGDRVIDYVEGRRDLEDGILRAIGDPEERFAEDRLRLLRAVRFAATFDFTIESATRAALVRRADEIQMVSVERIAAELRRMLTHPRRAEAARLLRQCRLLRALAPEWGTDAAAGPSGPSRRARWGRTLRTLAELDHPTFPMALAALLREASPDPLASARQAARICRRWKLSNAETRSVVNLLERDPLVRSASRLPWPQLQRILTSEEVDRLLDFSEAVARVADGHTREIEFCRRKLDLPPDQLDPAPLLNGDDLRSLGVPPGPIYKTILETIRDAQLQGEVATPEQAIARAERIWKSERTRLQSKGQ